MFIGHFALAFAAKRVSPTSSLATLFTAAQLADLLWPIFVAVGLEEVRIEPGITAFTPLNFVSYPYSHSLLFLIGWAILFATLCLRGSGRRRTFTLLSALVVSHWVLDFVTHRPDMPLFPGGPRAGLGLWNSVPATLVVETTLYAAGAWIYSSVTQPRDRAGRWGFAALAVFLVLAYVANVVAPPPPSVTAVIVTAFAGVLLLVGWSWWVDRHRVAIFDESGRSAQSTWR